MMDMDPISIFYNGKLFWELIVGYTIHIICPTASYPGRRLKRVEQSYRKFFFFFPAN